ncbi:MAG TPA: hypothetical protein PKW35_24040 [Nannocystaceae bacterium]|nr:hypothetical protein [Nannocystaceae bacterium]
MTRRHVPDDHQSGARPGIRGPRLDPLAHGSERPHAAELERR